MEKCYFSREGHGHYTEELSRQRAMAIEIARRESLTQVDREMILALRACTVNDLRKVLDSAVVLKEISGSIDVVSIGSTVVCREGNNVQEVTIGAWGEMRPDLNVIPYDASFAKVLMGAREGAEVSLVRGSSRHSLVIERILADKYKQLLPQIFQESQREPLAIG